MCRGRHKSSPRNGLASVCASGDGAALLACHRQVVDAKQIDGRHIVPGELVRIALLQEQEGAHIVAYGENARAGMGSVCGGDNPRGARLERTGDLVAAV